MATYIPAKVSTQYVFYASLVSQANTKVMQVNPTIAAGDFKVSIDGAALANLATLPTVTPAAGVMVKFTLSTSEMAGANATVVCSDAAGAEWCDLVINIPTATRQIDDLAFPATSGRSMVVDTSGRVDGNLETIKTNPVVNGGTVTFPTTATLASTTNITAGTVTTATNVTTLNGIAANVITAASIADAAIDRATFAADTGLQTIRSNTATAGSGTTITLDAGASATNDFYKNTLLLITGGTGALQSRFIAGYVGATKVATVGTWVTNPDNTSTFAILPFDVAPGTLPPTTAQIATAVWQDLTAGSDFTTVGSAGKLLVDNLNATITSRMATYTQPTGFLAATFPSGTVANTTNITTATGIDVAKWNGLSTVALPLVPTTAGRTLDVSAGGEAGVDWANVGSPTTALDLSATTIATTQKVDLNTIKTNPVVNGGTLTFPSNATLASTTNITAATGIAVGVGGISATSFEPAAIDATAIATDAIGSAELAASAVTKVWANACTEPTAAVAASPTAIAGLSWLVTQSRNKITQDASTQTLFKSDDVSSVATAAVADDGTTATRGKWA